MTAVASPGDIDPTTTGRPVAIEPPTAGQLVGRVVVRFLRTMLSATIAIVVALTAWQLLIKALDFSPFISRGPGDVWRYMFTAPDVVPARYRVDAGHARSKRGRAPKLEQVFELGRPSGRPDLIPDAFLYDYRMRRALFKASWSDDEAEFERFCDVFEARIVRLDPKTRTVRCRTLRRAVEHPARLGEKRPSHTLRTSLRRVERRALP